MYKKILAVDDDTDMLFFLKSILELHGYEVKTLSKGENVFNTVSAFKPDLILLDLMLAGLDGSIICSALKTMPETKHIPVIFISGHYQAAASVYNNDAGAPDDFLLKPFDTKSLIAKVEMQLAA